MSVFKLSFIHRLMFVFVAGLFLPAVVWGQQKSVNPGINKSFLSPDVGEFVERFEREGREVYDHREKIVESAQIKPGMRVADVGAGTGLFTKLIAKEVGPNGSVIAADIAKEFVDHVVSSSREAGLSNVEGKVCQPDSIGLPKESIDVAYICDTYHHFEFPYQTMRSIWRTLKPNGRVVLVEFHREEGKSSDWILGHIRASQDVFVKEIKLSGFAVVEEKDFLDTSYFMIFCKDDRTNDSGHTFDSLQTIREEMQKGTAVLVDVREQGEWDAGHLKAAQFSPLSKMQEQELKGTVDSLSLPKDQIIYTHCRSGRRSVTAAELLKKQGYDARALKAGFVDLLKAGYEAE